MDGKTRREKIQEILQDTTEPLSGAYLAKQMGVSRQVIVQDIALLRAQKMQILSTSKGYLLVVHEPTGVRRVFAVNHGPEEKEIEDELHTIVDNGGKVIDVMVEHDIYGEIVANLLLESRKDIRDFMTKMRKETTRPLLFLTQGIHYHTVEARDQQTLGIIEGELKKKKYLNE